MATTSPVCFVSGGFGGTVVIGADSSLRVCRSQRTGWRRLCCLRMTNELNSGEGFDGALVESVRDAERNIYERRTGPDGVPASGVLLVHGHLMHSGWFGPLARELSTRAEAKVHGIDLPSHGKSDNINGCRGYGKSMDDFVPEVKAALSRLQKTLPEDAPIFVLGESFGGSLVLMLNQDPEVAKLLKGVILCSPVVRLPPVMSPPRILLLILKIVSMLLPRIRVPGSFPVETWKKGFPDPTAAELSTKDPNTGYGEPIRVGFATALAKAVEKLEDDFPDMEMRNLLVFHYEEDMRSDISNSELILDSIKVNGRKELVRIPGVGHQVFQDIPEQREKTIEKVVNFVKANSLASKPKTITVSKKTPKLHVAKMPSPATMNPDEAKNTEPEEAGKTETAEAKTTEPEEAKKTEPVEAKKTEPVEAKKTEPVEAKKTEPVEAKKTEPVEAKKTEPVEAKRTEPVEAKKAEPVAEQPAGTSTGPGSVDEKKVQRLQFVLKSGDSMASNGNSSKKAAAGWQFTPPKSSEKVKVFWKDASVKDEQVQVSYPRTDLAQDLKKAKPVDNKILNRMKFMLFRQ